MPEGIADGVVRDDGRISKADLKIVESAIKNRYPFTDEMRKLIANKIVVAIGQARTTRELVSAIRCAAELDALNVAREKIDAPQNVNVNQHVSGGVMVVPARLGPDQWDQMAKELKHEAIEERKAADEATDGERQLGRV